MTPTADVVLPCLEEAGALPWALERLPPGWRAIVADHRSSAGSAWTAANRGATVVRDLRRDFGSTCHAGLLAAEAEFVCVCDVSLDPPLLVGFADRIAAVDTYLVLGRRRPAARGAFPPHARAGNDALARMPRRRTGLYLRGLGPMRAARRRTLLARNVEDAARWRPWSRPPTRAGASSRRACPTARALAGRRSPIPGTPSMTVHDMPAVLSAPTQAEQSRAGTR